MQHRTKRYHNQYGGICIEKWESPDGKHWRMISQRFEEDEI